MQKFRRDENIFLEGRNIRLGYVGYVTSGQGFSPKLCFSQTHALTNEFPAREYGSAIALNPRKARLQFV
jgi:hypothetical protein